MHTQIYNYMQHEVPNLVALAGLHDKKIKIPFYQHCGLITLHFLLTGLLVMLGNISLPIP